MRKQGEYAEPLRAWPCSQIIPDTAGLIGRNVRAKQANEPLVVLIFTTSKMGRFFQEVGRPLTGAPQPVAPEDLARFLTVSAEYGYWNATPEENAAVGIHLSF